MRLRDRPERDEEDEADDLGNEDFPEDEAADDLDSDGREKHPKRVLKVDPSGLRCAVSGRVPSHGSDCSTGSHTFGLFMGVFCCVCVCCGANVVDGWTLR